MASAVTVPRPLIPRRLLFGPPDCANPVLSPDGTRIAFLAPVAGVAAVHVGPPTGPYVPVTTSASRIETFHWCSDSRRLLYESDCDGDENWHLHVTDIATGHATDLTPFDGVQAILVALSPECPDDALVPSNLLRAPSSIDPCCATMDFSRALLKLGAYRAWIMTIIHEMLLFMAAARRGSPATPWRYRHSDE